MLGAVVAAFLITAVSWFLARRISRPLELMTDGAARFAKGELGHRLPVKGYVETLRDGALDDKQNAKRFLDIIVKHIALAHGGSVSVKSRIGAGSTFSIRIPIDG